jgi:hypothetical protein
MWSTLLEGGMNEDMGRIHDTQRLFFVHMPMPPNGGDQTKFMGDIFPIFSRGSVPENIQLEAGIRKSLFDPL